MKKIFLLSKFANTINNIYQNNVLMNDLNLYNNNNFNSTQLNINKSTEAEEEKILSKTQIFFICFKKSFLLMINNISTTNNEIIHWFNTSKKYFS